MKYYLELTLLPNNEVNLGFLWYKLLNQLHIVLVDNKSDDNVSNVAFSWPQYKMSAFPLGNKLRLFAHNKMDLQQLNLATWLQSLVDYVHICSIKAVPSEIKNYVCFTRKQCKSNIERLARRRAKRHNISYEQSLACYINFNEQYSQLPFFQLHSVSKGEKFKFFLIKKRVKQAEIGDFNCYGLAKGSATVPWF
jgi:CRISPR-associated endonuclease Csy4